MISKSSPTKFLQHLIFPQLIGFILYMNRKLCFNLMLISE